MGEHADRLCRTQRRSKNGSKMQVDLPLVSSCVFVRIRRGDRVKVLDIPGVLSLVGAKNSQSNPLRNVEIEACLVSLDPQREESHPLVSVGQWAGISRWSIGSNRRNGGGRKNSFRVVLTLDLLMQSTAAEVDSSSTSPRSRKSSVRSLERMESTA